MRDIIDKIFDNNGFVTKIDGLVYFWPQSTNNLINSSQLRILADELDSLNKDWETELSLVYDKKTRQRFNTKWTFDNGCHVWNGEIKESGYGVFNNKSKGEMAHRTSYRMNKGEIPKGMVVMHKCDNRACVNPDHLELGTHEDNMKDMKDKGRSTKGETNPMSKLTEEQVIKIFLDPRPNKIIAAEYDVAVKTIRRIKKGLKWEWLTKNLIEKESTLLEMNSGP